MAWFLTSGLDRGSAVLHADVMAKVLDSVPDYLFPHSSFDPTRSTNDDCPTKSRTTPRVHTVLSHLAEAYQYSLPVKPDGHTVAEQVQ